MFFDAHIHDKCNEDGGFIIGLMGEPHFDGTLDNDAVLKMHNPAQNYVAFYYVSGDEINRDISHPYLKYHPRRERYAPVQVIESIRKNRPKCVIIDTLNEPYWTAYDYWTVVREFPEIPFVLAHAGGYLVNDFIKICHFQKNVWLDFALTHTVLGKLGDAKTGMPYVNDAIRYALNGPFKNRILMSSDYPFFSQSDVVDYYGDYVPELNRNFMSLLGEIK